MKGIWNQRSLFLGLLLCMIVSGFLGCGSSGSILKNETGSSANEFGNVAVVQDGAERQPDGDGASDSDKLPENTETTGSETPEQIFVDVCGAVKNPGVYQLPRGSRIYEAIELAGGFLEEAERSLINQAGVLEDGQQIRIYTKQEAEQLETPVVTGSGGSQPSGQSGDSSRQQTGEQKININQADKDALMTLTGIGETRAEAIIAYREAAGGFSGIEELMQVDGIKEKTYEKLKDKITVQ